MKSTSLHLIARVCQNLAGGALLSRFDDRELLDRFTGARDEAAFAAILDRHSRLVWAVCRGLLPNDADAEDAFQATFVALLRGAAQIRHTRFLAPWLHTAATRIAKKIRLAAARRRGHEGRAARAEAVPTLVSNESWDALNLALHDEINRLPARLRSAFVLCVLEGQRHQDAAAQLGLPIGTISARVSRARKRLLTALSARGLTAILAASALTCAAATVSAQVPAALLRSVKRQAADGFVSASKTILHLACTVPGGALMSGKWLSVVLIAVALLTAAGSVWYANAQPQPAPADAEKPVGPEHQDDGLPPGALFRFGTVDRAGGRTVSAYSRDGRFVAVGDDLGHLDLWDAHTGKNLHVLRTKGPAVAKLAFTPDGRSLAEGRDDAIQFWSVPDGVLKLTHRHNIPLWHLSFSPDGRDMIYGSFPWRLCDPTTGKERWEKFYVLETSAFSANGKTVFNVWGHHLIILDAASGEKQKSVELETPAGSNVGIGLTTALAPDGRRLALGTETGHVYFCDPRSGVELKRFRAADRPGKDAPGLSEYLCIDGVREGRVLRVAFSPDSKWLGTCGSEGDVHLWEVATGEEVLRLKGHKGYAFDVAFGSDGRTMLTSGMDGHAYLWSLRPPLEKRDPPSLETLWTALAAEPAPAYRALLQLSETPGAAAFLRRKVLLAPPDKRLVKWIADLDSDEFAVREKAHQALADQGETALPALRQSLAAELSPEQRHRIEALVERAEALPAQIETLSGEELRAQRAIIVLEMLGTAEARQALQSLGNGSPGAPRTIAATGALKRMGQ